ncbi:response regulator [Gilvibacter sediminis]|uniref:response regulator n=1 Tax=Gilvibacter sediminis TaxID=379071 RepID=UPI002350E7EE|nr:response regulator [Gilvibacter sediminis]MDC7996513.1 response regulator [Gilvibacter sediminis]
MNEKLNILLLDDNKATNFLHTQYLKRHDGVGEVEAFQKGISALEMLKQTDTYPDIMFLDINMPSMDAWEFLDELRKLNLELSAAIYLLTTTISPQDKEKMQNYPELSEILFKPLDSTVIKSILTKNFSA